MVDLAVLGDTFTADDVVDRLVPVGKRRTTRMSSIVIENGNKVRRECIGVGFTLGHQVFFLVKLLRPVTSASIVVPKIVNG